MSAPTEKKWTVFFVVKAADSITLPPLVKMLGNLRSIAFPDDVGVVFCINFFVGELDAILHGDERKIVGDRDIRNLTTIFFNVVSKGTTSTLEEIERMPGFRITQPDHLQKVFKEKILALNQAKHYLLFTWDHGNGFEIFAGPGQPNKPPKTKTIKSKVNAPVLTMQELSQAIQWAMGNRKIDVVIMMNCLMQVFHTGYTLRNNVQYLIAPQSMLEFEDYDYQALFSVLAKDSGISPRDLVDDVMSRFQINSDSGTSYTLTLWPNVVSACNLEHFEDLGEQLDKLASKLDGRVAADFCQLRMSFLQSQSVYSNPGLVDLFSLMLNLDPADANEGQLIDAILGLESKCVHRLFMGKGISRADPNKTFRGISIPSPLDSRGRGFKFLEKLIRFFRPQVVPIALAPVNTRLTWDGLVSRMKSAGTHTRCS